MFANPVSFTIQVGVPGIGIMKLTEEALEANTVAKFLAADLHTGKATYNSSNNTFLNVPYIAVMSTHRSGFKITMGATALKCVVSDTHTEYVGYTVTAGSASVTVAKTDTDTEKKDLINSVISSGPITTADVQCEQIFITINEAEYNEAIQGTYEGTVKFYYTVTT